MANFCSNCGSPVEESDKFCPHCGAKIETARYQYAYQSQPEQNTFLEVDCPSASAYEEQQYNEYLQRPVRSKIVAGILALLLGGLGIHEFYLNKTVQGVLMLLFSWTGIPEIIAFIQGICILVRSDEDFEDRYHVRIAK